LISETQAKEETMMTKALAGPPGQKKKGRQALATMKDLELLYREDAVAAAAAAPQSEGAPRIVGKDGTFYLGEQVLPSPLELIVVVEAHLNVWYPEAYDPDSPSPPGCFAVGPALQKDAEGKTVEGTGEDALRAHATSPKIQGGPNGHDCATCELNKFGSADVGRGKACANQRVLAVVMADDPAFQTGQPLTWAQMSLSPTGLAPWGKFVKSLASIENRPPHGAVIQFDFNKRDPVEQKRKAIIAVGYKKIMDPAVATKVNALRRELLETKALLRPMPVDVRDADGPKKGKADAKDKKGAKKAQGGARRAKF
jgi:hypothetical protein